MKKKIILAAVLALTFSGGAVAASSINGDFNGFPVVKIRVDNQEIHPEVPGHIVEGSTLLPLRAISEALGANVQWHQDDYSVDISMQNKGLSLAQLNTIGENVAMIYALDETGKYVKQGSGLLLKQGVVVTNNHIGSAGKTLHIEVNGKVYMTNGEYLFKNEVVDLYAVKIDTEPAVPLNNAEELPKKGDKVYSLGFPHGKFQINEGAVLAYDGRLIMHSAASDPGSSGGLLISAEGNVVGIIVSGSDAGDYNGAIPLSRVNEELAKVK